jgi:hypothetical protein
MYSQNNIVNHGNFENAVDTINNIVITPTPSRHSVNLELFIGETFIYSLGYEKIFIRKQGFKFTGKIGFGIYDMPLAINLTVPVTVSVLFGKRKTKSFFFLGTLNYIQDAKPSSKEIRKLIRQHDHSVRGYDYTPFYRAYPFTGIGIQYNVNNMYFRFQGSAMLVYGLQTGSYTYYFGIWPYSGLTVGYFLKNKQ